MGLGREDAQDVGVEAATRILTRCTSAVLVTAAMVRVVVGRLVSNRLRAEGRECRTAPSPERRFQAGEQSVSPDVEGLASMLSLEATFGTPAALAIEMVALGYPRTAAATVVGGAVHLSAVLSAAGTVATSR